VGLVVGFLAKEMTGIKTLSAILNKLYSIAT
jgi:hypothetical protein